MVVFGPVPSRRLGRSLGINNIPPKHCSYSCLYCQVGATQATEIEPRAFFDPEDLFDRVVERLDNLGQSHEPVDYLTFVPDGEPTLDAGLGRAIERLRALNIKIAVISNASLINRPEVRDRLKSADWVSLKIDTVDAARWSIINRPDSKLDFDELLSGMQAFRNEFKGTLVTETMLLEGINTEQASIKRLGAFLRKLSPATVYLAIPTRPTADRHVRAPEPATLNRIYQSVGEFVPHVELLTDYEGDAFASTGNFADDILSITGVHPMREDAVASLLNRCGADWSAVRQLLVNGMLAETEYRGHRFYLRSRVLRSGDMPFLASCQNFQGNNDAG
ncbi:MAG: radical SAM protein [Methylomicrobium sp.]